MLRSLVFILLCNLCFFKAASAQAEQKIILLDSSVSNNANFGKFPPEGVLIDLSLSLLYQTFTKTGWFDEISLRIFHWNEGTLRPIFSGTLSDDTKKEVGSAVMYSGVTPRGGTMLGATLYNLRRELTSDSPQCVEVIVLTDTAPSNHYSALRSIHDLLTLPFVSLQVLILPHEQNQSAWDFYGRTHLSLISADIDLQYQFDHFTEENLRRALIPAGCLTS